MGINQTSDGSVEFIYYLGEDAKNMVLPHSVCDYCPVRGECEFHCNDDNLPSIKAHNPLDFTIKDIKTMYSIDEIKRTMFEKEAPISYGLATVQKAYYFECNSQNPEANDSVCLNCEFPCYQAASGELLRSDTHADKCCSRVGLPSYSNDAIFDLHGEVLGSGGHAMVIVGWNDEFRVDRDDIGYTALREEGVNRNSESNSQYNPVKGGFIIKNSWGNAGHSMAYWMQNISESNEAIICPLTQSIKNWGAVDVECLAEKKQFTECGFGRVRYVGLERKRVVGGTKLQCRQSSNEESDSKKMTFLGFSECSKRDANEYVYSLVGDMKMVPGRDDLSDEMYEEPAVNLRTEIPAGSDSQRIYHIAKIKLGSDGNTIESVEELVTNMTTLNMLEKVFQPAADADVQNSEHCGYYFQPYSTVRFLVSDYKAWSYESYVCCLSDVFY